MDSMTGEERIELFKKAAYLVDESKHFIQINARNVRVTLPVLEFLEESGLSPIDSYVKVSARHPAVAEWVDVWFVCRKADTYVRPYWLED